MQSLWETSSSLEPIIVAQLDFGKSKETSPVHCPQNWFYVTTSFLLTMHSYSNFHMASLAILGENKEAMHPWS